MIEQLDVMEILVVSCPSFREGWNTHLAEWGNDFLYIAAGNFAQHLLAMQQQGEVSSFPTIAQSIERLRKEGTPWVKEFAVIGVLEGIQNVWGNSGTDPEEFGGHLMPDSRVCWERLNAFWAGA